MKFLDENIWRKLHDFGLGNEFLDMIPNTQARKEKKDKNRKRKNRQVGPHKLTNFCASQNPVSRLKRQWNGR